MQRNSVEIPEAKVLKLKIWCGGKPALAFLLSRQKTIGSFLERIERAFLELQWGNKSYILKHQKVILCVTKVTIFSPQNNLPMGKVADPIRVVYNEKQGGSARWRLLSKVSDRAYRLFSLLNIQLFRKTCISVSAQYWPNISQFFYNR